MGLIRTIKGRISKTKTTAITAAIVAFLAPLLASFGLDIPEEALASIVQGLVALAVVFLYKKVDQADVTAQNESFIRLYGRAAKASPAVDLSKKVVD